MRHRTRASGIAAGTAAALVLVCCALGGCTYPGTHVQQVREWMQSNSYSSNEHQVVADAHSVELAAAKGTAIELRTVCGGLSSDAGTLYSTLTTPDRPLTADLNHAMQDFFNAGERCAVASSTRSAAARTALSDTRSGLAELAVASRRLAQLGIAS